MVELCGTPFNFLFNFSIALMGIVGAMLLVISIGGYMLHIQPFYVQDDPNDPCNQPTIHCNRMNPNINSLPILISVLLMTVPVMAYDKE